MKSRPNKGKSAPVGQAAAVGVLLVLLIFLLPLFLPEDAPGSDPAPALPSPLAEGPEDGGQTIRLLHADGTVEELSLAAYLRGVLAAEMPASFHPEALKAQAVAARTYCLRQRSTGTEKHPGADVCTDPGCCQAYLTQEEAVSRWGGDAPRWLEKLAQAVADTDGLLCLYEGRPIDAVFFSSAAGRTTDAQAVWGAQVPYLVPVDSPEGEEVPNWRSEAVFSPAELAEALHAVWPEMDLSGAPDSWFAHWQQDSSGGVARVTVGGVPVTGTGLRAALGLRSTHFTLSADEDRMAFQVTGHGHGVGMSQYGANALAAEGKDFREILSWYYTGVTVDRLPAPAEAG